MERLSDCFEWFLNEITRVNHSTEWSDWVIFITPLSGVILHSVEWYSWFSARIVITPLSGVIHHSTQWSDNDSCRKSCIIIVADIELFNVVSKKFVYAYVNFVLETGGNRWETTCRSSRSYETERCEHKPIDMKHEAFHTKILHENSNSNTNRLSQYWIFTIARWCLSLNFHEGVLYETFRVSYQQAFAHVFLLKICDCFNIWFFICQPVYPIQNSHTYTRIFGTQHWRIFSQ